MEEHKDEFQPTTPMSVVKEEPVEAGNQEIQQSQLQEVSNDDDPEQRSVCTPDGQENEIHSFLTKCIFCNKTFTVEDNPKLLECLHATCSSCIGSKLNDYHVYADNDIVIEGNLIICRACNVASQKENLIENKFFSKVMNDDGNQVIDDDIQDIEEEKKCTNCHDNATATSWCVDCEEFICQNCVLAHQRLKITKDHTIKPKNEVFNEKDGMKKNEKSSSNDAYCSIHPHEQLSLFCQICSVLTCRDCQLGDHRLHKYKFIHELAGEARTSVETLLKEVSYKRVLLKSAMKVIEDRQVLIVDKKKSLVHEITQMVVQLTKAISTRGKQLIMRLNEVCDQKQTTLNEKKDALDQLSKLTDHCIQFVTYALNKGSDRELLFSKKSIVGHLQRIKNRRADIPNPEIPVRIHLSLEKVPDLVKIISSIGAIVVDGRVYPSGSPASGTSTPTTLSNDTPLDQKLLVPLFTSTLEPNTSAALQMNTTQAGSPFPSVSFTQQQLSTQQSQPSQILTQMSGQSQNYPPPYSAHTIPPRSSPPTQHQRMPYGVPYNGTPIRSHLIIHQRPGVGNGHQQQVTSSTHPQQQIHLEQLSQNSSLRGLLAHNPPPFRATSNHVAYRLPPGYRYPGGNVVSRAAPPIYQPTNPALVSGGRVQQINPTSVANQQLNYPFYQQTARWHIPQTANTVSPYQPRMSAQTLQSMPVVPNDAYKIMLKTQQINTHSNNNSNNNDTVNKTNNNNNNHKNNENNSDQIHQTQTSATSNGQTVTSSIPKTPSPVLAGKTDENEKKSQKNPTDTSHVDSSTDEGTLSINENPSDDLKNTTSSLVKDDPNEDWCAVCMDGGDAVLCCDKCPKVFHLYCHIPSLKSFPDESETWQCMLCTNVLDCSEDPPVSKRSDMMTPKELRIAQRIVLELYCQYEQSLPFREVVSPEIVEYHRIIKKPIALDTIRDKLKPDNPNHYTELKQVMADIRLMLKNAFKYNPVDSQIYQQARSLEEFFDKLLLKWAPDHAYDDPFLTTDADEDEEVFPPNRKYRRIIND
ncbi:E3 ubiquitin-protein ligase TRIM33 isoform X2 [Chelonus insularis]|uniref:E3 ubiquitin-protein ligase TRIM33 isoform X2 n=1 Tax=Chelonus insularis TaxID=460826 RepID=UPI00158A7705|nr:E3 ubiquitin-protein ligase TRIM33 isoform X2 [Chelonus insularis]